MMRKTILLVHIVSSVALLGAVAAYLLLAVVGLLSQTSFPARASYWAGNMMTWFLILPLAVGALLSGLLVSISTPWGLLRHYWVVVKLGLTLAVLAVLVIHTQPIQVMAMVALDQELLAQDHVPQRIQLVVASGAGLLVILIISVLSVFKPSGLTRYGWAIRIKEKPALAATISRHSP